MTRAQNFYLSAWTCQALHLFLYILLVPFTSGTVLEEVCLRDAETCRCRSPPIPPPECPLCKRAVIDCPDDMTVRTQYVSYNYSVTYHPSGCIVDYKVPSHPSQETTIEVRRGDCRQFMYLGNSTCSPLPGFQFREGTTQTVTCQSCDYRFGVTKCSFNITVETESCPSSDFCGVQTLFIVTLVLNAVGWICCLTAALMPTTSQPARSHRGKGSKVNDDHADEAYVNELFKDIDSQENSTDDKAGTSMDETPATKSKTSHDHD